jgi:hypothetical protein
VGETFVGTVVIFIALAPKNNDDIKSKKRIKTESTYVARWYRRLL